MTNGAPQPKKPKRRRKLALLALASFAVALAFAELGLRVANAALHPAIYELDATLGWRHAPNVTRALLDEDGREVRFETDALGLRVTPHAGDLGDDARRLLFVGDSFTAGSEVEADELFVTLCERALTDARCLDAGVGGYSTLQQLLALDQRLAQLEADVVVLVVYENDFVDNLMPYFSGLGPRPYARVDGEGAFELVRERDVARYEPFLQPAPGAFWLYQHCAIYRAVHKTIFLQSHGERIAAREQRERDAVPLADQRLVMAELLRRVVETTRARGAELRVVALPSREMVRDDDAPSHAWLREQCARLDAPFLSLLEPLRRAGYEASYFARDIHLTAAGHAAVAAALAPFLR